MSPVRTSFLQAVFTTVVMVAVSLSIGPVAVVARAAGTAVVQVDRLNLRSKPSLKSRTIAVLLRETRVAVIDINDLWLKVKHKTRTGYLRNSPRYVKIESTAPPAKKTRKKITRAREKAKTLEKRIKDSEAAVVSYTKKEAAVIRSLDQIERSLHLARKRVAVSRGELDRIDREIAHNQRALDQLKTQIATAETYASGRLVALYKLGWLGRINILASADSMGEVLQRERALSRILDQDQEHLEILESDYHRLKALQAKQQKRKAAKQVLENEHRLRAGEMLTEKQRKSSVLTEIRSKKSFELAAIEVFREDAKNLDQAIRQIGLAIDRKTKRAAAKAAVKKETPAKALPKSFTACKGLLKLPVKGKIKNTFGTFRNEKFKTQNFRSGIDISADRGEPVYAVFPGRVLYSSWFKGYGNMLIIDHGNHYYTVYAHVEEIFKQKGEAVEDHEVIATVGDTGSMEGPGLYFEVRYHGKPLDPAKWIKKG
ncbi:MAG: peptidoglycan DD-metalloendopeptidase family protein [Desulfobacterales bacterium]|nr:peptidoglycan DD-metalloendopeptidase family protein [Desulfobacterales bacterium]